MLHTTEESTVASEKEVVVAAAAAGILPFQQSWADEDGEQLMAYEHREGSD